MIRDLYMAVYGLRIKRIESQLPRNVILMSSEK